MKHNLSRYLSSVFADAPRTPKNDALYEELLGNLTDRYDELIENGESPEVAYARAIGDLGDITPLFEKGSEPAGKKQTSYITAAKLLSLKILRGLGLAVAVALYILWTVPIILWGLEWPIFLFAALGTVVLLLSRNLVPDFVDDSGESLPAPLRRSLTVASAVLMAVGIGLCVISVLPTVILDNLIGDALLFAIAAVGVACILFGVSLRPKFPEAAKEAKGEDSAPPPVANEPEKPRSKRRWIVPMVVICALLLVLGVTVTVATHLGWMEGVVTMKSSPDDYKNVGDGTIEGVIDGILIEWIEGDVTVERYDGDHIRLVETGKEELLASENERMRWYVDERNNLRIRYDGKERVYFRFRLFEDKDLTVQIPSTYPALDLLVVENTAGTVSVSGVDSNSTRLNSVSGDIKVKDSALGVLAMTNTSGSITLTDSEATSLGFETVSGSLVTANTAFRRVEGETVSGDVTLALASDVQSITVESVSGDVRFFLQSASLGFRLEMDSVSGRVDSDLAISRRGESYHYGDGAIEIEVDTTSGDVIVEAPTEE